MAESPLVLLIEDEARMRFALSTALRGDGYTVAEAANGNDGLEQLERNPPRVVLLDLGLPDMDGQDLARRIRERSNVPIIVVSVRSDERNQIEALDSGANDYIIKPVREGEFLARVRAALRNGTPSAKDKKSITLGAVHLDVAQRRTWVRGEEVTLTPTEFRFLLVLMQEPGQVVTHRQLLRRVWGAGHAHQLEYLRVYMRQLRAKIELSSTKPEYLITLPGIGYVFRPPD